MNDIDTRLRDTLQHVATTTRTTDRVEDIVRRRQRRPIGFTVAAAAFVLVVLVVGVPAMLNSPQSQQQVGSLDEPVVTSIVPAPAIDPAWLTVEAEDLEVFAQLREQGASVHGPGWRPGLHTESVWCMYSNGTGADTMASEFPMDQDLTRAVIEAECGTGNDPARNLESPPETFTFCRGVFADSAYKQWSTAGEMTIVEGQLDTDRPGFPIVLGWESDCVSEHLDTSTAIQLDADLSFEAINRARQIEIAVTGASYTNCFTYDQATVLAEAARQQLGDEWLLTRYGGSDTAPDGLCHRPTIDLQWGAIYIGAQDRPTSTDQTFTTLPPE